MAWAMRVTDEYAAWLTTLIKEDLGSAILMAQGVVALRDEGRLGPPSWTGSKGARIHHLKELRPESRGRSEIRIIFSCPSC